MMKTDELMRHLNAPGVFRVGGSVRDEWIGRESPDADYVVTGITLEDLKESLIALEAHPEPLELRHRPDFLGHQDAERTQIGWRAIHRDYGAIEVCLPRAEVSTGPDRHDFVIVIDPYLSLENDALRRDFTVNALYKDVRTGQLLDPLKQGMEDLRLSVIRTTYPTSFRDDPLRTLRALRFVSTLPGFDLVEITFIEMCEHADAVTGMTPRGVSVTALNELQKMLMGRNVQYALEVARDSGVLGVLLPELLPSFGFDQQSKYHDKTVDQHTFEAVQAAADRDAPLHVRMALLFHDSGKPFTAWEGEDGRKHYYARAEPTEGTIAAALQCVDHEVWSANLCDEALRRLNAPRKFRNQVVTLVREHMLNVVDKPRAIKVRKKMAELGTPMLRDLLLHSLCDASGKGEPSKDVLDGISMWIQEIENAERRNVPLSVGDLHINGSDVKEFTQVCGKGVGLILKELLHECMADPSLNSFEWLVRRATKLAKKVHDLE